MLNRHRRFAAAVALTAVAGLGLAACGSDTTEDAGAPGGDTTSASSAPAALARALNPDEATAEDTTAGNQTNTAPKAVAVDQPTPAELVVTDIRVGSHQNRDRVVFELAGTGVPGYTVDYVDSPAQQGSGNPVEVGGDSFLQVMIDGQTLPTEGGPAEVEVGEASADEATGVAGVAFAGQFEGRAQAVIGLEGTDRPYTVFTLQNPTRVVVDVEK